MLILNLESSSFICANFLRGYIGQVPKNERNNKKDQLLQEELVNSGKCKVKFLES